MKCCHCNNHLSSQDFSNTQIKKPEASRKFKSCLQNKPNTNDQLKIFPSVGFSAQSYILEKRYVEIEEYEQLKRENADLKNRIATYEGTFVKLHDEIHTKNLEIEKRNLDNENLRRENKELKEKMNDWKNNWQNKTDKSPI